MARQRRGPRYTWPKGQQSAVVLSFDVDAESAFIFREPEKAKRSLGDLEERRFGPRVGVDRILRLLDRLKIRASFYIPGWTVVNHLAPCKRIRDAGHEIGAHGNVHEAVGALDEAQEKRVLQEQLRILEDQLGVVPTGYRSPSWDVNVWTPGLLKQHGFLYDTSLMGNDIPYELETPEGPLTEVPVQWIMDDAPLFRHVYGATNAIAEPARIYSLWSSEFTGMHEENGCFVLTCHPWISGRASRIALIEDFVRFIRRQHGVWFATCEDVAKWHARRLGRASTNGARSSGPPSRGAAPRRRSRGSR